MPTLAALAPDLALPAPPGRVARGVLEAVGETPLVHLERLLPRRDVALYAKLEAANPGGSAKDRPARLMLERALADGRVGRRTLVVESSSGNTAVGLAQACRYHRLRFVCVVDPRTPPQTLAKLRAYGAAIDRVEEPDPESGDFLAARLARVRQILARVPNAFWPNQYANPDNARAHQEGTMREIDQALGGRLDHLFVAVSSTGTIKGCGDYLRQRGRSTRLVAVDAVGSVLFGGRRGDRKLPGLGAGVEPPLARDAAVDRVIRVDELDSVAGCRHLVHHEGILAGASSGAVVSALLAACAGFEPGAVVAAIFADGGDRYLDTVYDDDWVERELGRRPPPVAEPAGRR